MAEAQGNPDSGKDIDLESQIDIATAVAAKTFGQSIRLPFAAAAAVETQASDAITLDSSGMTLGGDNSAQAIKRQQSEEKTQKEFDAFRTVAQQIAEASKREQEEWDRTNSTVAGVTMNGAEWRELADRLRNDGEFQNRVMDAFKARGMTAAEAKTHVDRVADIADIASKPPAQRTEEENERLEKANTDPAFKADMKDVSRIQGAEPALGASANSKPDAQISTAATTTIIGPGI